MVKTASGGPLKVGIMDRDMVPLLMLVTLFLIPQ